MDVVDVADIPPEMLWEATEHYLVPLGGIAAALARVLSPEQCPMQGTIVRHWTNAKNGKGTFPEPAVRLNTDGPRPTLLWDLRELLAWRARAVDARPVSVPPANR